MKNKRQSVIRIFKEYCISEVIVMVIAMLAITITSKSVHSGVIPLGNFVAIMYIIIAIQSLRTIFNIIMCRLVINRHEEIEQKAISIINKQHQYLKDICDIENEKKKKVENIKKQ